MAKDLIVVYNNHDKILGEQVRKLVEKYNNRAKRHMPVQEANESDAWAPNEDDSTINLQMWSKSTWDAQTRAGDDLKEYILFLDPTAGRPTTQIASMTPVGHGIKYGYMGNRAAVHVDTNDVYLRGDYVNFLRDLMELGEPVPNALKQEDIMAAIRGDFFNSLCVDALSVKTMSGSREFITDHKRRQMLFYGLTRFWNSSFEDFMEL